MKLYSKRVGYCYECPAFYKATKPALDFDFETTVWICDYSKRVISEKEFPHFTPKWCELKDE